MKYSISFLALAIASSAFAYGFDPSTITNWEDKVSFYQSGLRLVRLGKGDTPDRKPREPSATAVNLFMEEEILRYTNEQIALMQKQFPGLESSDYPVWKTMTSEQKKAYRRRYKAAWLEAFVDATYTEYIAWLGMTPAERAVWEDAWGKAHKGCTEFVPPPLMEDK